MVRAAVTAVVTFEGVDVEIAAGTVYPASDPLVAEYPDLFVPVTAPGDQPGPEVGDTPGTSIPPAAPSTPDA
jgi:hypothetical protein